VKEQTVGNVERDVHADLACRLDAGVDPAGSGVDHGDLAPVEGTTGRKIRRQFDATEPVESPGTPRHPVAVPAGTIVEQLDDAHPDRSGLPNPSTCDGHGPLAAGFTESTQIRLRTTYGSVADE